MTISQSEVDKLNRLYEMRSSLQTIVTNIVQDIDRALDFRDEIESVQDDFHREILEKLDLSIATLRSAESHLESDLSLVRREIAKIEDRLH